MKEFDLTEFNKLKKLLKEAGIPYTEEHTVDVHLDIPSIDGYLWERYEIYYPSREEHISDVIISYASYGREDGLLEQMNLIPDGDSVEGYLDAETVFKRWSEDWQKRNTR